MNSQYQTQSLKNDCSEPMKCICGKHVIIYSITNDYINGEVQKHGWIDGKYICPSCLDERRQAGIKINVDEYYTREIVKFLFNKKVVY